jgi:hypothetical protein
MMARRASLLGLCVAAALAPALPFGDPSGVKVTESIVNGRVFASLTAPAAFTDDVRRLLKSGVPVRFTFTVELQRPSWFWDPTLAATTVAAAATFDSLTGQYQASKYLNSAVVKSELLREEADVRTWFTAFERVPLEPARALEPNADYYIRVRLRARPKPTWSIWPFGGDDASGRKDFTFIR